MPVASKTRAVRAKRGRSKSASSRTPTLAMQVDAALSALRRLGSKRVRDDMARSGIQLSNRRKAFGVPVAGIQQVASSLGRNHKLAAALWNTGHYEARMLAAFVDEPKRVTSAQMDRWCREFDNCGIVDAICFELFDQVPQKLALEKVERWSRAKGEFQKRAGFVLLACLALRDRREASAAVNKPYADGLLLIEREASDDRNFVKKAVSWALRSIGRRGDELRRAALWTAQQLAASAEPAARWVGRDALRDLSSVSESQTPAQTADGNRI